MYVSQDIINDENLHNTLDLLKLIVQAEDDIESGNMTAQDVMFTTLEEKLFQHE